MKKIKKEIDGISITHSDNNEQVNAKVIHTDGSINYVFNHRINEDEEINDFEYIEKFKNGIYKENEDAMYIYSDEDLKFIADFLVRNEYILDSRAYYVVKECEGNCTYFWDKIKKQRYTLDNPSIWYDENEDFILENKLCGYDLLIKYMEDQVVFTDVSKLEFEEFLSSMWKIKIAGVDI